MRLIAVLKMQERRHDNVKLEIWNIKQMDYIIYLTTAAA